MDTLASFAFVVIAYLIGSLSFAVLISALMGLKDPRTYGSNNPGATNVLRSGNKAAAVLTLLGDGAKGYLAVWLAERYAGQFGVTSMGIAMVALAVFLGHLYPVFFKFKGGKGVATAAGVLLAIDWRLGLATLATWIIIVVFFRYSSLAALVSALFAIFFQLLVFGFGPSALTVIVMSLLLIWRHRANIEKLMAGKESKLFAKKK